MNSTIVILLWVIGAGGLLADLFAGSLILSAIAMTSIVASVISAGFVWGPLEAVALGIGSAAGASGLMRLAASRLKLADRIAEGPSAVLQDDRAGLVGQRGVAATLLRPAGFATIGGRRIDVVTQGDMLEAGAAVEVLSVDGPKVVVRRAS